MRRTIKITVASLLIFFVLAGAGCPGNVASIQEARDRAENDRLVAEAEAERLIERQDALITRLNEQRDQLTQAEQERAEEILASLQVAVDAEVNAAADARDRREILDAELEVAQQVSDGDWSDLFTWVEPFVPAPIRGAITIGLGIWGLVERRGKTHERSDREHVTELARTAMHNLDKASTSDGNGNKIVNKARARELNGPELSREIERVFGV